MNKHLNSVIQKRIERTMKALEKNYMQAFYAENKEEALNLVKNMLTQGAKVAAGGSVTLAKCGIIEYLKTGGFNYLDRAQTGLDAESTHQLLVDSFSADFYLSSSNAITENGELYNVDGNGNRVAALIFGPKKVIIVAGYNKIVKTLDDAIGRVKTTAAPANAARLNYETYCLAAGECMSLKQGNPCMAAGCKNDARICCSYTVLGQQRIKGRISVIIVGEELGF